MLRCCAGCLTSLELDLGRFAVKDSHCNRGYAYMGAQELVQTSFSGLGANAVIGAFCSSASMGASDFLKLYKTPLLSPTGVHEHGAIRQLCLPLLCPPASDR